MNTNGSPSAKYSVAMKAALPFTDGEMRELFVRTLAKVEEMTEAEFAELEIYPADEV